MFMLFEWRQLSVLTNMEGLRGMNFFYRFLNAFEIASALELTCSLS